MLNKIRRINVIGGPCTGKSVIACKLFAELKCDGFNTELIHEHVKGWAHENRKPKGLDQIFLLGKQIRLEERVLANVDFVICESPLVLSLAYATYYELPKSVCEALEDIIVEFEYQYPSYNILLPRQFKYKDIARFQQVEELFNIDNIIVKCASFLGEINIIKHEKVIENVRALLTTEYPRDIIDPHEGTNG